VRAHFEFLDFGVDIFPGVLEVFDLRTYEIYIYLYIYIYVYIYIYIYI